MRSTSSPREVCATATSSPTTSRSSSGPTAPSSSMLLDFSLAEASERDVAAGTRGYLDPFLGTARRPVYDDHAERYAAAVTLHEMASGARPVWGDGITDPRTTTDEAPTISAELFEPALRDELVAFFRRALHRDVDRRFDAVAPDARGVARRVPRVRRGGTGDHAGHRRARPAFAGGVPGGRRPGRPARHPAGCGRALAPGGVGGPVVRRVHRRRAAGRAAAPDRPRARCGGGDPQGDQPAAQAVGRAARGRGTGRARRRPVRGRRAGVVADVGDHPPELEEGRGGASDARPARRARHPAAVDPAGRDRPPAGHRAGVGVAPPAGPVQGVGGDSLAGTGPRRAGGTARRRRTGLGRRRAGRRPALSPGLGRRGVRPRGGLRRRGRPGRGRGRGLVGPARRRRGDPRPRPPTGRAAAGRQRPDRSGVAARNRRAERSGARRLRTPAGPPRRRAGRDRADAGSRRRGPGTSGRRRTGRSGPAGRHATRGTGRLPRRGARWCRPGWSSTGAASISCAPCALPRPVPVCAGRSGSRSTTCSAASAPASRRSPCRTGSRTCRWRRRCGRPASS